MSAKEIIQKISQSKKYKALYEKTIERVVRDCLTRYPEKEAEKRAKNLLHQIWGAYFQNRPHFQKLLVNFKQEIENGKNVKEAVRPLLQLQSSIRERAPILDDFYRKIFSITGVPDSIIDHACGLNPLTYFWLPKGIKYFGFDIDKDQAEFLKSVFKILNIDRVKIDLGDILTDKFPQADIVFLLKLLPLLEHQQKGSSLEVLKKQRCKYLVVSFPTKTVSGKEKGMIDFYSKQFQDLIRNELWQTEKILFPTELIFIVKKPDNEVLRR
jgi:16S rRNA (guanine(1405)-N(7))-methyltransferase